MKNIQVIDGAENATYDIFAASDDEFDLIFVPGTDVAFVEDFVARVGEEVAGRTLAPLWSRRADKKTVQGIHGTLFFGLEHRKKYYPARRDSD